jgi:3-oxoacyl-[acyl-carrier protein] reductase
VTGAGQGIGRAIARALAREGAQVVVADINEKGGNAVVRELEDEGLTATFIHTDVSSSESCEAMASGTIDTYGRIDVLVNNAAIFSTIKMKPFWEISEQEWAAMLDVNLTGVWLASKAVVPTMRAQGRGSIINMSSGVVWVGRPMYAHYVASKAGVLGLSRAMARELGEFDVRVNTITPGAVFTEIPRETVTPEQKVAMVDAQALKRPLEPDDLVGAVVFLASDDSAAITGQALNVDSGITTH